MTIGSVNEDDRRVIRTRRLLRQALLNLIEQKEYGKISIRDVTDEADIGYATFFRHYDGVDDLMLEIFTGIIEQLESLPEKHAQDYFEQEGTLLFRHISDNQTLYRAILSSHAFTHKLRSRVSEMMLEHIKGHSDHVLRSEIPLEAAAVHMVSSLVGLIEWWLEREMQPSVEKMASIYERLIIRATWQGLSREDELALPWET
jgi:AcrR family transcriptional regulator